MARLERAKGKLSETDQTISDIAAAWRFGSIHHFSHAFKAAYGVSPSVFRKHRREGADSANPRASCAKTPPPRKALRHHNALGSGRPLVLVFPEGAWRELMPESTLLCEDPVARSMESELRIRLYQHEHFLDDKTVERNWFVSKIINGTHADWGVQLDWGLAARHRDSTPRM
jgi:hypothetical protein